MNENQTGSGNLLDTTDCLEAVGVFKGWKNFFFIILVLCILLLQACFWLVDLGMIPIPKATFASKQVISFPVVISEPNSSNMNSNKEANQIISEPNETTETETTPEKEVESDTTTSIEEPNQPAEPNLPSESVQGFNTTSGPIMLAAQTNVPSPNEPSNAEPTEKQFLFGVNFSHVVWTIRFVNAVLILISVLYCLTMIFSLKVSMLGRLGGINHITRAFFLSLIMLILVLPWQIVFDNTVIGAIFTSGELVKWQADKNSDTMNMVLYYLRFCGYMVLVFLLLILAQIRSSRWAKAILRRLEII